MDEKEMREAFADYAYRYDYRMDLNADGGYEDNDTAYAWIGWQRCFSWMMGKAEPFMYAISHEGKAYFDENCVSPDAEGLEYEVDNLNDANDGGFSVIPLYTASPMQNPEREIVLPELPQPDITESMRYWDSLSMRTFAHAAVLLDRKGRS